MAIQIHEGLNTILPIKNAVITTGTFDGVHVGHQKLIQRLQAAAKAIDGETVVVTFHPHPRMVLFPNDTSLKLLSTKEEKIFLLNQLGVDHIVFIPFTKEFSKLSALEYVEQILVEQLQVKKIIIGYDHQFGNNREGNLAYLMQMAPQFNFEVEEIPAQEIDDINVSSTKIRNALQAGNIRLANTFLSHPYTLSGKVVHGDKIGRTLGFPTANLEIEDAYKLIPSNGIYAVLIELEDKIYQGMAYIGMRSVVNGTKLAVEVNIFNFKEECYGKMITLQLLEKLREDQHFDSLESLVAQMKEDEQQALNFFHA